ncbi:MFS transporter [Photorhabdus heterorhabditis]|uniref:Arabinose ABC transporter permease n=1 Tax=Photorhabdus heterorhabditis TaxID=880156 RepID=A0ABR5KFL8_9GAMM|nr:MFS transporter [Photorhabdus heterorhabditis]KOY63117.1 arabinose ABC transporter permease [Photorhabdus heterorhabditis]MBS9442161.1 MFS transporter [Photorhabdus heterorhabditis]NRN30913.1 MFS transporter [Photorhabdus heterorhabditis subsp. aluminescens]
MNRKIQYPSTLGQNTNYTFLFILSVTIFLVGATEFMLSSMLTPLAIAFETTTVGASWLVSGYAFSYALAAPVLGYFSDRVNRSRLLLGSLLFFAVDGLAIIFAPTLEIAVALRIFGGIASAVIIPTVFALIADIVPYNCQAGAMGVVMLGMTFGIAFGPALAGILTDLISWQAPFLFSSLGCTVTFIAGFYCLPTHIASKELISRQLIWFRQWSIVRPLIAKGAWNGAGVSAFLLSGEVLRQRYGFGPTEIGLTVIAFGTGLGIGNISAGGLRKLCGREEATLVVVSLLLTGVISVFMLVPITLFGSLGCLIFWGIALGAGAPSSTVVLVTRASANKGMVLAFAETFNNLGILSLVPLAMIGLAKGGPPAAMIVLSIGLVIGISLTILDFWLTRSKSSASSLI